MYSHLQEVFKKLILHYPDRALEKLEEVSYLIKHHGQWLKMEDFLVTEDIRNYKEMTDALGGYIEKFETHFKVSSLKNNLCSNLNLKKRAKNPLK